MAKINSSTTKEEKPKRATRKKKVESKPIVAKNVIGEVPTPLESDEIIDQMINEIINESNGTVEEPQSEEAEKPKKELLNAMPLIDTLYFKPVNFNPKKNQQRRNNQRYTFGYTWNGQVMD